MSDHAESLALTSNQMKYKCNPKHRNGKPESDKTMWLVNEHQEETYFWDSVEENYVCDKNCYWWVDVTIGTNEKKIIGQTDTNYAYIAKFKSDRNNEWHGYPVTGERTPHDVPHTTILNEWKNLNFFSKKEVTNLRRGRGYVKSCS
ncbi:hypothetical protein HGT71_05840 [Rosenbergiella epipactidis]|uniref:hypothetical protein n=1 Tax=Rosenbergiella epipactidis TaxID=1544694 RepID=UPI001BDAF466|nr:hypothetical protein [Rosenbergiella epipactidis]MBT0717793.1 hypothetical protein [Rosenbergiella epipactidis]